MNTLPQALESEQGLLGCISLDPSLVIPALLGKRSDPGELFYDLRHKEIFRAMVELHNEGIELSVATVPPWLKNNSKYKFDTIIGDLLDWEGKAPTARNFTYHLKPLVDKATRRQLFRICGEGTALALDEGADIGESIDVLSGNVIGMSIDSSEEEKTMRTLVDGALDSWQEAYKNQGRIMGVASGFYGLDKITGGFEAGQVIVIAARPTMGKTSLAMNIAAYQTVNQGNPVGVFSLEMSDKELTKRMICSLAGIPLGVPKQGRLTADQFNSMAVASSKLSKSPLHIDDKGGLSIQKLTARARRMVSSHGVKLIVVDYLQLLHGSKVGASSYERVSEVSAGIKQMAKELELPVILLSQLNRDIEKGNGREPQLSDLRDSGSIEQDADIVIMLHEPDVEEADTKAVNLLIRKNRSGAGGKVALQFHRPTTSFKAALPDNGGQS